MNFDFLNDNYYVDKAREVLDEQLNSAQPPKYQDTILKEQADDIISRFSKNIEPQIVAIEKIAKSSQIQADISLKQSKKADIKGWIAISISALALLLEFVLNRTEIISFIKSLFNN